MQIQTDIDPFSFMLLNFEQASKDMPANFKSLHWDAFPNGYSDLIKNKEIWPRMLRNAITIGFNDALISHSNQRFHSGDLDLWKKMKEGGFPDLIKEENGVNLKKILETRVKRLIHATNLEYVAANCLGNIGNPVVYELKVKTESSEEYKVRFNLHDHDDIYHSWFITNQLKHIKQEQPIVCEIGAGYGGLAAKIKNNIKKSKIVLFDLPEVNAVQSYYLLNLFPEQKIFGYQDFLKYGSKILDRDFDFLIMPGWTANDLLRDRMVDAFINVRSMMEMNRSVIENYFKVIQTSLRENGVFVCINRYIKKVINQENNIETNRFADYPFDTNWSPLYSFPSEIQPHIHLMIAKRESKKPLYPFIEILKTLRQNAYLGN